MLQRANVIEMASHWLDAAGAVRKAGHLVQDSVHVGDL